MGTIISALHVFKNYGTIPVLKGVSLDIKEKEVVSIVGPSGAGKSTLLQILGTLDKADKGDVTINEINVSKLKDKALSEFRNSNIGFIFQFHHLMPEFTAIENVCMPAFIAGVNKSEAEPRAIMLLNKLGLADRVQHKPSALSGGEQQRVAVARALMNAPKIIFADEPSGNLDTKTATELHQLFFQLRDELGITFVIVTHNEVLAQMSDRILTMKDGQLQMNNNQQ
jgi:lipoprotein-releasing system ATP-binding protein